MQQTNLLSARPENRTQILFGDSSGHLMSASVGGMGVSHSLLMLAEQLRMTLVSLVDSCGSWLQR